MAKQKTIAIALGAVALAAVLAAVLLPKPGSGSVAGGDRPVLQQQTVPRGEEQTGPVQTTVPETTEPLQTEPVETQPVQTVPTESTPPQSEPEETIPVQTEPVETQPLQTEPAETIPVQTEPAETQPVQTAPTEPRPIQTEPVQTQPVQTEPAETEPAPTVPPTEKPELFPVVLEDGMLTVQSVFQFSGMNPDADNQFGENIAAVQLVNTSEQHLTRAEIEVFLADGTLLTFQAEDVAPGMTVMAFSPENMTLEDPALCAEIYGYAEFEQSDPLQRDLVGIHVEGMAVTVTNLTTETLTDLEIICHGLLDGSSFGGRTYTYSITSLSAGASTIIFAQDCILGAAEVVRVELGE